MPARTGSAARRYAEAVFDIARSEDRLDAWEQDLAAVAQVLSDSDEAALLTNPAVPPDEKAALIDLTLASVGQEARNMAHLLVGRGRAHLAGQILAAYRQRLDSLRGIVHAQVTTAVPLNDQERAAITDRLARMTNQQVTMETDVDPAIIGGVVVRLGDKLIDGSARARLIELKRRLAGAAR